MLYVIDKVFFVLQNVIFNFVKINFICFLVFWDKMSGKTKISFD